jgi:sulfite reductase beta subunit-like hemoprotein
MSDERDAEREERVKVVYCGGCNPHIDRSAVAAGLPLDDPDVGPGATLHLSGCPRACASDHQLTGSAADGVTIVVAGELVDGVPTPETQLTPTITRKLKE